MEKQPMLTHSEWQVMELLWQQAHTLMELVSKLEKSMLWSKSTVATMVRRMCEKELISYSEEERTRVYRPNVSRDEVSARETESLLQRAYHGSVGLLVSAMAQRHDLTKADIDELYAILKEAEEDAT